MKILFVCRGNIGRSQFAEALYKKYGNPNNQVSSAGTTVSFPGQTIKEIPLAKNVIDSMAEEGIDVSQNYIKPLNQELFDEADRVVLFTADGEPIPDYMKNSDKVTCWSVPNPKGTDLETHRKIRDQIKQLTTSSL